MQTNFVTLWRYTSLRRTESKASRDHSRKWKKQCDRAEKKKNGTDDDRDASACEEERER